MLCRFNGNKFQRCTTEVFDREKPDKKKEEKENGCERENRLLRRRQGGFRAPVKTRTVGKELII